MSPSDLGSSPNSLRIHATLSLSNCRVLCFPTVNYGELYPAHSTHGHKNDSRRATRIRAPAMATDRLEDSQNSYQVPGPAQVRMFGAIARRIHASAITRFARHLCIVGSSTCL